MKFLPFSSSDICLLAVVEADNDADDTFIGHAKGLKMSESNARAFAAAIGENFNERAYICGLMDDGILMEKHRLLNVTAQ